MDIWQRTDQALKKANVPISIIWSLTHRCNLNCCHCYNVKDASELAWPQVRRIGAQLRKAGCLFITLTGGEVFIRRDFFKIAALLRRLGFDIRIITNGTLVTGAMAQELKKISPSEIGVSVLGATAATHDRITGVRGSFDKTLNAITLMKEQQLPVHMRSTILKENFQEYRSIIKLAKRLGIHFLLDPVVSPKDDGSRDVLSHRLDCSQMERFFRERTGSLVASPEEEKRSHCEAGRTFCAISASVTPPRRISGASGLRRLY
jgi:MoaA/NifB/PqqE/SkfB family radical SAM enzyme